MAISDSGTADLEIVGTSDIVEAFHSDALWKIDQVGTGYVLHSCRYTTADQCLRPNGSSIATIGIYEPGNNAFVWTLTPDTAVPNLMLLIDAETCYPVTGSFHTLYEGERATLEDLGLMVSYVSQHTNDMDYYWQTSGSDEVGITNYDEVVVYGRGETVFSVHASGSTNTPMYFIVHSPYVDDGAYYIRNWYTNYYIEVSGDTSGYSIYGDIFLHDSSQLWNISYLGNREYSIQSIQSPYYYLGINNDATGQGGLVTYRIGPYMSHIKLEQ